MALNLQRIVKLSGIEKNESTLSGLVVQYLTLKRKIEGKDNHSWYFKQGLESGKKRLLSLNDEYEEIRKMFNETTLDEFIEKTNHNLERKAKYEKSSMNSIKYIHYRLIVDEINFFNELIRLKSTTESLLPIEEYADNPEGFLMLLG